VACIEGLDADGHRRCIWATLRAWSMPTAYMALSKKTFAEEL
jgi:hypothetical protein